MLCCNEIDNLVVFQLTIIPQENYDRDRKIFCPTVPLSGHQKKDSWLLH